MLLLIPGNNFGLLVKIPVGPIRSAFKDDESSFAEEIFGFHAQPPVEKTLKAWLSCKDISYPKSHNLEEIVGLLEDGGESFPRRFSPS
jgi:HEPN domain-containing protein